jgi:hypothetical protein
MSFQVFAFALVVGAALLAVWVHCRRVARTPVDVSRIALHAAAGFGAVTAAPSLMAVLGAADSPARAMLALFALVLPAFVYCFLTWIWLLKLLQRLVSRAY